LIFSLSLSPDLAPSKAYIGYPKTFISVGECEAFRKELVMSDISKPDMSVYCVLVYKFSHDLLPVMYSENKDFLRYKLLEKNLRS
jgi:hypothetical protein